MPDAMNQSMRPETRALLRQTTRPFHDRVDAAFGQFDLTLPQDYAAFLVAHHDALSALAALEPPFGLPRIGLRPALEADLEKLNAAPHATQPPLRETHEAYRLGCYYVVAGSQAGARVLRRQWAQSSDGLVLSASRYFDVAGQGGAWAAFRALEPPGDLDRARLVAGACDTFELFHRAARAHLQRLRGEGRQPAKTAQPQRAAVGGMS